MLGVFRHLLVLFRVGGAQADAHAGGWVGGLVGAQAAVFGAPCISGPLYFAPALPGPGAGEDGSESEGQQDEEADDLVSCLKGNNPKPVGSRLSLDGDVEYGESEIPDWNLDRETVVLSDSGESESGRDGLGGG